MAHLKRTPASVESLKNLQSDRPPMLNHSVFAVTITVAFFIAFVDMISALDESISKTGGVELCLRVRELLFTFGIDQVIQA